ncbi:hypothetical protein BHM03_00015709 [Ensete ventricosum]|nr:hypothetical protein BHM03_00015709 [Ensete ventricosum]
MHFATLSRAPQQSPITNQVRNARQLRPMAAPARVLLSDTNGSDADMTRHPQLTKETNHGTHDRITGAGVAAAISRHQQGGVVGTAATNHFGFDPLRFPVYDLEAVCFRSSTPIPALLDSPSPVSLSIPSRRPRIRVPKNGDRDLGALPPLSRLSV